MFIAIYSLKRSYNIKIYHEEVLSAYILMNTFNINGTCLSANDDNLHLQIMITISNFETIIPFVLTIGLPVVYCSCLVLNKK